MWRGTVQTSQTSSRGAGNVRRSTSSVPTVSVASAMPGPGAWRAGAAGGARRAGAARGTDDARSTSRARAAGATRRAGAARSVGTYGAGGLERAQVVIEPVKAVVPEPLVGLEPLGSAAERSRLEVARPGLRRTP